MIIITIAPKAKEKDNLICFSCTIYYLVFTTFQSFLKRGVDRWGGHLTNQPTTCNILRVMRTEGGKGWGSEERRSHYNHILYVEFYSYPPTLYYYYCILHRRGWERILCVSINYLINYIPRLAIQNCIAGEKQKLLCSFLLKLLYRWSLFIHMDTSTSRTNLILDFAGHVPHHTYSYFYSCMFIYCISFN